MQICGKTRAARLEVVVVAAHAGGGEPRGLLAVSSPSEHATSSPVSSCTASTASITLRSSRSSGPRTATTMQNCVAPASRVARAAARISSRSRNAYTSTPVWKRTDCEQNAQSSGHAPDLALIRLSSSTSGPHHARRTWWASAIERRAARRAGARRRRRLGAGEPAALVEQGAFGVGQGRVGGHEAAGYRPARSPNGCGQRLGFEQWGDRLGRHRAAEVEALGVTAAERPEGRDLLGGLDAFRDR